MNEEGSLQESFELAPGMQIHLVGIGGSGISAIAQVLLDRGYRVTGSDLQESERVEMLKERGASVTIGHQAENIGRASAVIISSAIPADNPELIAARQAGVPVLKRADFLPYLMVGQAGIAVAGTHGKTTTTAMIAQILLDSGYDPSVIVGGDLPLIGGSGRSGDGDFFLIEADEYDHMFLGLQPDIAVITNIEHDHPDIFPTRDAYLEAFREFAALLPEQGTLIAGLEDAGVAEMLTRRRGQAGRLVTYGLAAESTAESPYDLAAIDTRSNQLGGTDFVLLSNQQTLGLVRLRVPGLHNVRNALAAIAVALEVGVEFTQICRSLAEFGGVGRRFQLLGEVGGVTIIDDYAHHPTEIEATLAAARQRYGDRRLWAIWQPHTFSRTKLLLPQFSASFAQADRVLALDIYRSRETDSLGIDTADVVAGMQHEYAVHVGEMEKAIAYLLDRVYPGDVVLTLGAGDGNLVGYGLLEALKSRVEQLRP